MFRRTYRNLMSASALVECARTRQLSRLLAAEFSPSKIRCPGFLIRRYSRLLRVPHKLWPALKSPRPPCPDSPVDHRVSLWVVERLKSSFRTQVASSGISDEELHRLLSRARDESDGKQKRSKDR